MAITRPQAFAVLDLCVTISTLILYTPSGILQNTVTCLRSKFLQELCNLLSQYMKFIYTRASTQSDPSG